MSDLGVQQRLRAALAGTSARLARAGVPSPSVDARALIARGSREVYVCATHAVFSGPACDRLSSAPIAEVTVTDTVNLAPEKRFPTLQILSVGELLAKAIRFTHSDQSVSSLFE